MNNATKRTAQALAIVLTLAGTTTAFAQEDLCGQAPHAIDSRQGECSPGTQAPSTAGIMAAIESGSDTRLQGTLEYAERVDCAACVPRVLQVVFTSDNERSREFAAWWLRRRPAAGWIAGMLTDVVAGDYSHALLPAGVSQELLRARAASALGEFLIPQALAPLRTAAQADTSAVVREAAVSALGRLNHPESGPALASAFADADANVRHAALANVLQVNFFRDTAALVGVLDDETAENRAEAALLIGQLRVSDAVPALSALLLTDESSQVRRSAAWALGRVGTTEAQGALLDAAGVEADSRVLDAIEVAQRMR
jgi:HEAT repeat protein